MMSGCLLPPDYEINYNVVSLGESPELTFYQNYDKVIEDLK